MKIKKPKFADSKPGLGKKLALPKKLPKPSLGRFKRGSSDASKINQAIESLPRITNETVAEHREEMLKDARKLIYPLRHSRSRVVKNSVILSIAGILLLAGFIALSLYKFQASSTFFYGVTRVLPLPAAKAGSDWVSYESYLFELRHLKHYYETQQEVDFKSDSGKAQLTEFKKQAMDQAVNDAYTKQLAQENGVSVSRTEVDNAVSMLREQNRLGNSEEEFEDVLKEFWGWKVDDFRRELNQQLLAQKVVAKLDTATSDRIRTAEARIQQGTDFGTVAAEASDDVGTKGSGGEYPFIIDRSSRDVAPKIVDELFKLQPGQTSGVIDTGYTLEIVKVISNDNGKIRAAHISSTFKPITDFIAPLKKQSPPKHFIKI